MHIFWVNVQVSVLLVVFFNVIRTDAALLTESEIPEREAFLRPRHFNPHPFESTNGIDRSAVDRTIQPVSTSIFNQGPIQFPPTNQGDPSRGHGHPYAAIALRNRQNSLQRFAGVDNNILPTYIPLSRFGKKIVPTPHRRFDYDDDIYDDYSSQKKQYAFSYSVKDAASGDDFSHTQQQKDGTVRGSYKVHLPDGRIQVVRYHADDNGYHADVSYNEEKVSPTPQPTYNYLKGFAPSGRGDSDRNFNYDLYVGQPVVSTTVATPVGTIPSYNSVSNVHIQSYNAPEATSRAITDAVPTTPTSSYYLQSTSLPPPRINFISTTPASPYKDITVVPITKIHASVNPYGARKATAINPEGSYEYGNTVPSSTYATNYDYDYDGGYKVGGHLSSTETTRFQEDDPNQVALYYQNAK
ncbi:hypothetical protein DMENIID0001_021030 [Sergentomyia squamirostris]